MCRFCLKQLSTQISDGGYAIYSATLTWLSSFKLGMGRKETLMVGWATLGFFAFGWVERRSMC